MELQFDITKAEGMPNVIITGNYCGGKTFPSLNNLLAAYAKFPKAGNAMKQKYQRIAVYDIQEQLGEWKATRPLIVHYRYFEPKDGHYRDYPNIHGAFSKIFLDALQVAGVIPNDDPKHVLNETHDFFYIAEGEPFVEIYLEEVGEQENG